MDDYKKYFLIAVNFLKYRPRSEKEIRDKLQEKKALPQVIDVVVEALKKEKFLNDLDFARWWIRQRTEFRPKPKRVIMMELLQKGIAREIVSEAFADKESPFENDVLQAKQVGERQVRRYRSLPRDVAKQKLAAFLARRGFSWETIKSCIDDILSLQYNTD